MRALQDFRAIRMAWSALVAIVALSGCAVQYVSRYDAITEQSITDIQRSVAALLQSIDRNIGSSAADHVNYVDHYQRLHIDAAMLNARAQAISQNSITSEQSAQLIGWLDNLETLHESGIGSPEVIAITRQMGEQIFVAMLKFELAKKRQFDTAVIDKE